MPEHGGVAERSPAGVVGHAQVVEAPSPSSRPRSPFPGGAIVPGTSRGGRGGALAAVVFGRRAPRNEKRAPRPRRTELPSNARP